MNRYKGGRGCKHTVCIPRPLLPHGPRLCAPPMRPHFAMNAERGRPVFSPFRARVGVTPPLCAKGECRAAHKRYAPSLSAEQDSERRVRRRPFAPPCLCEQDGEKAPPFEHGPGGARERVRMGGVARMGGASQAPLLLRAGVPRKRSAWSCPLPSPFRPTPCAPMGPLTTTRATREAGGAERKPCPSPHCV